MQLPKYFYSDDNLFCEFCFDLIIWAGSNLTFTLKKKKNLKVIKKKKRKAETSCT